MARQIICKPQPIIAAPLGGKWRDSCFTTVIDWAKYSAALTSWVGASTNGYQALLAAYKTNNSGAAQASLDALAAALQAAAAASNPPLVGGQPWRIAARIRQYANTAAEETFATTTTAPSADELQVRAGLSALEIAARRLVSELKDVLHTVHNVDVGDGNGLTIGLFTDLTPNQNVHCTCPEPPSPGPTPGPGNDCPDDEDSSSSCDSYGHGGWFPKICYSSNWSPA